MYHDNAGVRYPICEPVNLHFEAAQTVCDSTVYQAGLYVNNFYVILKKMN